MLVMIAFHFSYDLKTFWPHGKAYLAWLPDVYWERSPHVIGTLFLFSVGISSWLQHQALRETRAARLAYFRDGLKLLALAILVSLGTAIFTPEFTVYFGALHCIAVVKLLIQPCLRQRYANLIMGVVLVGAAYFIRGFETESRWLIWLGVPSEMGMGGDWYPLVPWFGVALIGAGCAAFLADKRANFSLIGPVNSRTLGAVAWFGRHALIIYLLHQPVLVGLIKACASGIG